MAGILSSYSDSTCNTHNALRNITGYACGVTFSFKPGQGPPPDMHYAVVSLQECCARGPGAAAPPPPPVLRVPGNTGCEMQFCVVPVTSTTRTWTYAATGTGTGTAPQAAVSTEVRHGPPGEVESCLGFVYEGDLPGEVGDRVADAGSWCVARMYDTELPDSEVAVAVAASPAAASWTAAAANPWDAALSSASATPTPTPASNSARGGRGRYDARSAEYGVKVWAFTVLMTIGLAVAL
ncbi:hypothetical protein F5X99DRAFT_428851 [Biscogniauxia marginata]|nr:hypothetical protein F5X99DRAFT_428851 [Biscogniauxia marginata]